MPFTPVLEDVCSMPVETVLPVRQDPRVAAIAHSVSDTQWTPDRCRPPGVHTLFENKMLVLFLNNMLNIIVNLQAPVW